MIHPKSKFRSVKTSIDGILFDSKKEASTYAALKFLKMNGNIKNLELQKKFTILDSYTNGFGKKVREIVYVADFYFFDVGKNRWVVLDAKGLILPVFKLKKKLFEKKYYPLVIETDY